jgi:hypothetical protein
VRPRLALVVGLVLAAACSGKKNEDAQLKPELKSLGQQAGDVASDTAVLRAANGAAGEVVRNTGDCPAARAAIGPAYEKLDALAKQVKTETGRVTIAALRKQVDNVAELCP